MCVDPEISSAINVSDTSQTSVTVSWSTGQTQEVDSIVVYYKAAGAAEWTSSLASQFTVHTVSTLQPGTQYQLYVHIISFGKAATSNTITLTTGKLK